MFSNVLNHIRKIGALVLIMGVFMLLIASLPSSVNAAVGVNQQMNFQGRLFNNQGATVPDGLYNIEFKIYQDGDGLSVGNTTGSPAGTLKWTESHINANGKGIVVKNGFFSVQLGSVNPFGTSVDWNQNTLFLSMNIAGVNATCTPFSACSPDGEMVPMKRLSANPYSLNSGLLGGLSSANFLQLAQGVQTDVSNIDSIQLNKTGSGNLISLQSSGVSAFTISNSGNITLGSNADKSISIAAPTTAGAAGKNLTLSAGAANGSGAAAAGGNLTLQGGNAAGTGNANGGNITLTGGTGIGTGLQGLVNIGASTHIPSTFTPCAINCTIPQTSVDNYGTIIIGALVSDVTITLPPPTDTTAVGRIIYLTTTNTSLDYNLATNSADDLLNISMRQNSTAAMIWSGAAWAPGGASNATTLQATYNNGKNPATTPEIKLDSTRGTIDIQDADTSIGTDIFNIRGSNAGGLGTVLFGVSNSGRVTIQDTSDQSSSFRVLNSAGNYLFNINSNNNYVFSNSIRSPGNEIVNPHFEAGGSVTGGEEGWFGPVQANFVNDSTNARNGNYSLQVTPNASNLDIFAGSFYEVKPGDGIYLEGYVKSNAISSGDVGIQITWYNKDKTILSYSTNYAGLPGSSYSLRKINATAPAGAHYARVSATVRSTAASGTIYFDDFYMKRNVESADITFRNTQDSTAAFRIQSAVSANTLFAADTTNNILKVGDSTGSDTATTLLVLDSATVDPTTISGKNGGLFYRSDTNSLKVVIGGTVVDVCTTAITCTGYSASASSGVQLQATSPGTSQTGNFNITGTGILTQLQTQDRSADATNSSNLMVRTGNATGAGGISGNLTLDVGTGTGGRGSIRIGSSGVNVTMGGTLDIQGSNSLMLGTSSSASGAILFRTAAGGNTINLQAPGANPAASYTLTLPQNLGSAGYCLKDTGSGVLGFSDCGAGLTVNLQDVYNNSSPANITLADNKSLSITSQQTLVSPSILMNLQCTSSCNSTANGRFSVQNNGVDVLTVSPNGGGIILNGQIQVGSITTDSTQVNLKLDSSNSTADSGSCTQTINQGAMYYNTTMGSIRACINGSWGDLSNPDTLGLLSYGIVPSTGVNPYDLPSLTIPGASGPCKVSWSSNTTVSIESCVAYSGGRRVNVAATTLSTNSTVSSNINLTTTERWGHICLVGPNGEPRFTTTAGVTTALQGMPNSTIDDQVVKAPILCLASVQGETLTAGRIDNIYDTRTFTSTLKEAVTISSASELGMITDASGTNGAMSPAVAGSQKLYGLVVATDGGVSTGKPNAIVSTVGPGWVKAVAGTAGQFVRTSTTAGHGDTVTAIPNNSFYYSVGNTRTSYSTTCTAASNCNGSLYINFIVR